MAPVPFGLVCFRRHPAGVAADDSRLDEMTASLLARVNATRRVHLTHTRLGGRYVIRVVIGQRQTGRSHVEELWRLVQEAAT